MSVRALFVDYSKAFDHQQCYQKWPSDDARFAGSSAVRTIRRIHSFLSNRQQRVKIGSITVSERITLNGGIPQGTWFDPYVFLILIEYLHTMLDTFQFVDDVTRCAVVTDPSISHMQHVKLSNWSNTNLMNINTKKTKEMLLGSIQFSYRRLNE